MNVLVVSLFGSDSFGLVAGAAICGRHRQLMNVSDGLGEFDATRNSSSLGILSTRFTASRDLLRR